MPDPFSQEQDQQRLQAALGQAEIVVEVAGGPETTMVVEPVTGGPLMVTWPGPR